jgi:hypothetical protein
MSDDLCNELAVLAYLIFGTALSFSLGIGRCKNSGHPKNKMKEVSVIFFIPQRLIAGGLFKLNSMEDSLS